MGFPEMRGALLGVTIIRTLIQGNEHVRTYRLLYGNIELSRDVWGCVGFRVCSVGLRSRF